MTNTGPSIITGDLGVSPGLAITGFPPGIVTGTIYTGVGVASGAQSDVTTAYNDLAGRAFLADLSGTDLGGQTLPPGVYKFSTTAALTGTLMLDAQGDPNAVFIFQIGTTLTTASNSLVLVTNGGQACNVFWQVGSSATLGSSTTFAGSILALASITMNAGASTSGRLLASNGAVTLDGNLVSVCSLALPAVPPALGKAFGPATVNAGGVSTLTVTLSNPDVAIATLTAPFIDTLPSGVVIAAIPNVGSTCGGAGVPVAVAGGSTVTLPAGRSIAANSSCTLTVDVTAAVGGSYINTLLAGALVTSNGNNSASAIATLTVLTPVVPPALGKAFIPATVNAGGVSTLTVTLSNPDVTVATLTAPLIDTLPSGVVIAPTPNVGSTCGGAGVPVAVAGNSTVTLPAGRSIAANSSCTLTVDVTAAVGGSYINTLPAGTLITSNGNNSAPAIATLTVLTPVIPPALGKAFSPATVNAGSVSTLTVALSNANAAVATLTAPLIDTLPSGVVIAPTPNVASTCGGAGAPVAVAGSSTVTLPAGRSIAANSSCTLTVDVTAAVGGSYINTLPAGALVTTNGNNTGPAIATLTVLTPVVPPALGKAFSPATVNAGSVSTLTVTLSNANAAVATLTAPLIDTLPSGVVIAPTPNVASTCGGAGAPVAVAGGSTVTLAAGRSIAANSSCTLTVDVIAALGGSYINTLLAGALVTSNGNNAAQAIATLTVLTPAVPPALGKAFGPATINAGSVSTLTVTLSNPDIAVATLTAPLVDTLPSGVVIAPTPNVASTCGGAGGPIAVAGSSTVTLPAGRSIAANSSCTLTVDVTAAVGGSYINTLLAGALVTSNGNNAAPAIATLTVVVPCPIIAVSPSTLPDGVVGTPYNQTISASPPGTYTLSVLTGSLPAGLSLNTSTGVITGAPTAIGSFNFTIAGTNASGCAGTQAYTVTIAPAAIASQANPIPTLSEWAMIALAALMAITGCVRSRTDRARGHRYPPGTLRSKR